MGHLWNCREVRSAVAWFGRGGQDARVTVVRSELGEELLGLGGGGRGGRVDGDLGGGSGGSAEVVGGEEGDDEESGGGGAEKGW